MHTDDTPVCPRHTKRHGDPWCPACRDHIADAVMDLPDLHTRLCDAAHRTLTPTRAERRPINGDPASQSPLYDDADEIAAALRGWAAAWADHLADKHPHRTDPRTSATYLLRHRRNADLLASPLALDLGTELTALHARARHTVGDTRGEPLHLPVAGACPYCESTGLWREDGTEDIHCGWCGPVGSRAEYEAHRAWLCQKYTGAISA